MATGVTATRVVSEVTARALVEAAVSGRPRRTCGSAVAFAAAVATTATTPAATTRPPSGALAAIALGTLLLPVAQLRRCGHSIDHVHVAGNRRHDCGNGGQLLASLLRLAIVTRRSRFTRLARFTRGSRLLRRLWLALALRAA